MYESSSFVNVRSKRFQCFTILHAKLFLLLQALPVWWSSLNLNTCIACRYSCFYSLLWVRTGLFLSLSAGLQLLGIESLIISADLDLSPTLLLPVDNLLGRNIRCGLTNAPHRGTRISFVRHANDLFMKRSISLALLAAVRTLTAGVNTEFTVKPRSLIYSHSWIDSLGLISGSTSLGNIVRFSV